MLPKFFPAEAVPIATFVTGMVGFGCFMLTRCATTNPDIIFDKKTSHDFLKPVGTVKEYNKLYHVSHFKD